jgi:hypothetical protein
MTSVLHRKRDRTARGDQDQLFCRPRKKVINTEQRRTPTATRRRITEGNSQTSDLFAI